MNRQPHDSDSMADLRALLRGPNNAPMTTRAPVSHNRVQLAVTLIDKSGLPDDIAKWRAESAGPTVPFRRGRPPKVDDRAVLALIVLLAFENSPLLVSNAAALISYRLTDESKALLGIDVDGTRYVDWYDRTWRALHRLLEVVDPFPINRALGGTRRSAMTKEQFARVVANRDPVECARRQERLDDLTNRLIEATHSLLPRDVRRRWKGNSSIDATKVATFGKRGTVKKSNFASIEPDAAFYKREGDHYVDEKRSKQGRGRDLVWAWEAHLVVQAANHPDEPATHPLLITAISFDKPGHKIAANAMKLYTSMKQRGLPAGLVIADRAYLPGAKADELQLPLIALGHGSVHDYKITELGITGGHAGAIQVEGKFYCPSMPQPLIDATRDYREGHITDEIRLERVERRRRYELRPKALPDADGAQRLMCPAVGPSATVDCPLRPRQTRPGRTRIADVPYHPDRICTNNTSVTFPASVGAKFRQSFPFGTAEWAGWYGLRNTIESINGLAKDGSHGGLDDSTRRRVRGYAAQYLFTTLLAMAVNVRKIDAFLDQESTEVRIAAREARRSRRRRRTESLTDYLPEDLGIAANDEDPPAD